jgi:hypothetical protein
MAAAADAASASGLQTPRSQVVSSDQAAAAADELASHPTEAERDHLARSPGSELVSAQPGEVADAPRTMQTNGSDAPTRSLSNPQVPQGSATEPQRPPMKAGSMTSQLNPDEIAAVLSRGSNFLKAGDFAAARILFRRAAESGSASAALMLGKTFDPLFLHELGAVGIEPDLAQCRQWYQKAVELGSEAAVRRLANLAQTGQ